MVKKILFFTLSNFGDVILTLPVLDALRTNYPDAQITVMVGPRASEVFKNNPYIHNLIIYNKYAKFREKKRLFFQLKKERFGVVIDLRNTLFGALLPARFRTSPFLYMPLHIRHMKEQNLYRLSRALRQKRPLAATQERLLYTRQEDEDYINNLLQKNGIRGNDKIVIISPAAGGRTRRWEKEKFIQLCQRLCREYSVILIGRRDDKALIGYIQANCKEGIAEKIFDLAGLTNLAQLSCLLERSALVVTCDTGILHLASYLDIPIVALFGPSDEQRYGPWSSKFRVVTTEVPCRPCRKPECRFTPLERKHKTKVTSSFLTGPVRKSFSNGAGFKTPACMQKINVNKVWDSIDALLKLC